MRPLRISSVGLLDALLALCVLGYAFLLGNLGCSSGAVCYRQTDCPSGTSCKSGACVRAVASGDAGIAGGTSEDPDAGTAGGVGTATSGGGDGIATAGGDGTGGGP